MPLISSRQHGAWDYAAGLALIAAPWLLGFADRGPATYVPVIIGLVILGMSLITNYELSLAKIVPLPIHLVADMGAGVFLAVSPWIFGFAGYVYLPHLIVGLTEVLIAATTVRATAGIGSRTTMAGVSSRSTI